MGRSNQPDADQPDAPCSADPSHASPRGGFLVAELAVKRGDEYRTVLVGAYVTSGPIEGYDPQTHEDIELTDSERRLAASVLGREWVRIVASAKK
jgi:hypothetical protein